MKYKPDHKDLVGNDKYEGYVVDLIQLIAKEINITYEFRLRNDGNGKKDKKTGKWDGLIGEVHELVRLARAPTRPKNCRVQGRETTVVFSESRPSHLRFDHHA